MEPGEKVAVADSRQLRPKCTFRAVKELHQVDDEVQKNVFDVCRVWALLSDQKWQSPLVQ